MPGRKPAPSRKSSLICPHCKNAVDLVGDELRLRTYNAAKKAVRLRMDEDVAILEGVWDELSNGSAPLLDGILRRWLESLPREDITSAMHLAIARKGAYPEAAQYLGGIIRAKVAQAGSDE